MTDAMRLLFGACLTAYWQQSSLAGQLFTLMKQRIIEYPV